MKSKLCIVNLMRSNLDGGAPAKVYYIYEQNLKGHLLQKHGVDKDAAPFKSKEAARRKMDHMLLSGKFEAGPFESSWA